jgi:hypothetical protein
MYNTVKFVEKSVINFPIIEKQGEMRILHVRHKTPGVFSFNLYIYSLSAFFVNAEILLAYSETTSYIENQSKIAGSACTLKDFWRNLGRRLNAFLAYSPTRIKHV